MVMYMGPLAVRHEYGRQFAAAAEKFAKTAAAIINLSENDMRDIFQAKNIPVFDAATDACFRMLRGYIDYGKFLARRKLAPRSTTASQPAPAAVERILNDYHGATLLPPSETVELLKAYGFQCAESIAMATLDEAKTASAKLGYPVILKANVSDVAHRSDAGLVSAKIVNDAELDTAFVALAATAAKQSASPLTINVDRFVAHDLEVILGVKYDATFGPTLLCGLGGIFTEVLKDFSLRLAPLTKTDADDMLASLKAFPVLQKIPGRLDVLVDALLRLSNLAVALNGKIRTVDINPIGLADNGSAPVVLDAKIHL
jgi:acetyltransferase